MTTLGSKVWDMLHLIRHGGPALCNIAITNSCNATCDFCNFANGKVGRKDLRWIDAAQFDGALDILHGRGIRYVSFFGGEPLFHPRFLALSGLSVVKVLVRLVSTIVCLLFSSLYHLVHS